MQKSTYFKEPAANNLIHILILQGGKIMRLFKSQIIVLLVLSMVAFFGYGCDTGSSSSSGSSSGSSSSGPVPGGRVCTEDGGYVSGTSDTELKFPCNISRPTGATTLTSGYTGTLSQVRWLAEDLAEAGYVVLSFTPTNTLGMVSGWRTAHKNCVSRLQTLNTSHSVLRGKIEKLSTNGHSKGGGGSLWASSELRGTLATTVGMAPYQEGFSDSTLRTITAATLIQAGSSDTLASGSMTRGEYNGVGAANKCYATYSGGHMLFASNAPSVSRDTIAWMGYYMYGIGSPPSSCSGSSSGGCN